jgi:hypothetical protein
MPTREVRAYTHDAALARCERVSGAVRGPVARVGHAALVLLFAALTRAVGARGLRRLAHPPAYPAPHTLYRGYLAVDAGLTLVLACTCGLLLLLPAVASRRAVRTARDRAAAAFDGAAARADHATLAMPAAGLPARGQRAERPSALDAALRCLGVLYACGCASLVAGFGTVALCVPAGGPPRTSIELKDVLSFGKAWNAARVAFCALLMLGALVAVPLLAGHEFATTATREARRVARERARGAMKKGDEHGAAAALEAQELDEGGHV